MKAIIATFNQEKALVGAFSVILKTDCETDGSFYSTNHRRCVLVRVNSSGPQIILDKSLRDRVAPDEAQMFTFWVVSDH